jgi:hypothetical protein
MRDHRDKTNSAKTDAVGMNSGQANPTKPTAVDMSRGKTTSSKTNVIHVGQTARQQQFGSQGTSATQIDAHEKQQQGAHDRRDATARRSGEDRHTPREPKFTGTKRQRGTGH